MKHLTKGSSTPAQKDIHANHTFYLIVFSEPDLEILEFHMQDIRSCCIVYLQDRLENVDNSFFRIYSCVHVLYIRSII